MTTRNPERTTRTPEHTEPRLSRLRNFIGMSATIGFIVFTSLAVKHTIETLDAPTLDATPTHDATNPSQPVIDPVQVNVAKIGLDIFGAATAFLVANIAAGRLETEPPSEPTAGERQ